MSNLSVCSEQRFVETFLKSSVLQTVEFSNYDDPRQVFTEQIFQSKQLCIPALLKTIHMIDPIAAGELLTDQMKYSVEDLKKLTWNAISNEVLYL